VREVVVCLKKAGFFDVIATWGAVRTKDAANQEMPDAGFVEFPIIHILKWEIAMNLSEARISAAQCLLDAGYRNFRSKAEIFAGHPLCAPAECTPDDSKRIIVIEFLNGIERYTPKQIAHALISHEAAQATEDKYAQHIREKPALKVT
jgi:hypothetical protein